MDPILLFLTGLGCGVVCLWIGLHIGLRLGRRAAPAAGSGVDGQQVKQWLGDLSQWTSTFHREVADYTQEMQGLTAQAGDVSGAADPNRAALAVKIMSQMLAAHQRLQSRLNDAENRLHRQSEELQDYLSEARTDGLTELPNRRALDEELARRMAEWRRYGMAFSVALLDIDRFKEINDRFGHMVGDGVLRAVARSLRASMRDADLVGRFGGEEFAIIMPATTAPASFRAIDRAREAVESVMLEIDGEQIRPTVSCGASQSLENDDAAAILQRADAALYTSKCSGRNQSNWHDGHRCLRIVKPEPEEDSAAEDEECVTA